MVGLSATPLVVDTTNQCTLGVAHLMMPLHPATHGLWLGGMGVVASHSVYHSLYSSSLIRLAVNGRVPRSEVKGGDG